MDKMPVNWFDMLLVIMLLLGLQRGRTRGLSEELFSAIAWFTILIAGAFLYEPLGTMLAQSASMSPLLGFCLAYLGVAIVVAGIVSAIKRGPGARLAGSDAFGRGEFYLGMVAGMVRFLCITLVFLALLNARQYNAAEIRADIKYQNDVYGSNFFPKLYTIQSAVFEQSITGPWIKKNLSILLIKPTGSAPAAAPDQPTTKPKQKQYASP